MRTIFENVRTETKRKLILIEIDDGKIFTKNSKTSLKTKKIRGTVALRYFPSTRLRNDKVNVQKLIEKN